MRGILIAVLLCLTVRGYSSHIVGGEFEIAYQQFDQYRLNLIVYFDLLNGSPGAKDISVTASIFRKRDNRLLFNVIMPITAEDPVSYTQPACSKGEIKTQRIIYSSLIRLKEEDFSDDQGYYVVWQRCCRNYTITNVYSEDPANAGAQYAGQTFYMEFPPVVKDGQPFRNSSPRLFPPLNDYACPNRPYYVDFAGVDDDGDSLVYSLSTPLNTKTQDALPPTSPRPYPDVLWRPGYGVNKVIGGNPDLRISESGFLTVTPRNQGLYVFAVKCEEFRNGVKIGEVRRDFQMLVLDKCQSAEPPVILGSQPGSALFDFRNTMSVSFPGNAPEADRCLNVRITDADALKEDDDRTEKIAIRAIPIGFQSQAIASVLPQITTATLANGSSQDFQICLPACPYLPSGRYQIGIIAADDACSLPLSDTLQIEVHVAIPPNQPPAFTTPDVEALLQEGDAQTWPVAVSDPDGDPIDLASLTGGVDLTSVGMSVQWTALSPSSYTGVFTWDADCTLFDFGDQTAFGISLTANDQDLCNIQSKQAEMTLDLSVQLPPNAPPEIDSDLTPDPQERRVEGLSYRLLRDESIVFNVTGTDAIDNDRLALAMSGDGFDPTKEGIKFEPSSGNGSVNGRFEWFLDCSRINLTERSVFPFRFLVVDNSNRCRIYKADTLDVVVQLLPPDNAPPSLEVEILSPEVVAQPQGVLARTGQEIRLRITGRDTDTDPVDQLVLSLKRTASDVRDYTFSTARGSGTVESEFRWTPDCSVVRDSGGTGNYGLVFLVEDDRCNNPDQQELEFVLRVEDQPFDESKLNAPNVITPNGDGLNDWFALDDYDEEIASVIGFPNDNCARRFEDIRIFNRWGKTVFQSRNRYFRWNAAQETEGVYFYTVRFNDYFYKGSVTVVR